MIRNHEGFLIGALADEQRVGRFSVVVLKDRR